jgi:hypothetical protein
MDAAKGKIEQFAFPDDVQDKIENKLRQSVQAGNNVRPDLRSARPERSVGSIGQSQELQAERQPVVIPQFSTANTIQQKTPNTLVNQVPPITPISTADSVSLTLPSKFAYYKFKDLYIKPFRVPHLAKLSKAIANEDSMQLICEVVSSVLSTPTGEQNIGFQLTVADFNAVLYWLRANSFPKSTMKVVTQCQNEEHHKKIFDGLLTASTLDTESIHNLSELSTNFLDNIPDPEYYQVKIIISDDPERVYCVPLRPERMIDAIEFLDDPKFSDEEFQYLARIASYLDADSAFPRYDDQGQSKRWVLEERISMVIDHLSNEDVLKVLEFSNLVEQFGVNELVQVKCKECEHVQQTKLTIDARTFLSPSF